MAEEWRDIPGVGGYQVSDHGRVRSLRRFGYKILKPNPILRYFGKGVNKKTKIGSFQVSLNGKRFQIHRLVLLAFCGPAPKGFVVCHNDDDGTNNHLSNLRWDTQQANAADALRNSGKRPHWNPALRHKRLAAACVQAALGFSC